MADAREIIDRAIVKLEATQTQIGTIQISLLEILVDEEVDHWDATAQAALIKLENVQRDVGEVQVQLLREMSAKIDEKLPDLSGAQANESTHETHADSVSPSIESPKTIEVKAVDPKNWLVARGIKVRSVREVSGLDATADRAALFLGERFGTLREFYDYAKRRVSGRASKWFPVKDLPGTTIADICRFCSMLHGSGFLSEFKYIKRDKVILFVPVEDGRIINFFTGAWLERYALELVKATAKELLPGQTEPEAMLGTQAVLPDGGDAEFDILVGLNNGKVLWIECKTGEWQNYVMRFQSLNKRFVQLPASQAALVLLQELTGEQKASASVLTAMTVLHLSELAGWLTEGMVQT
jgi:hypothetical protein